MKLRGYVLRSKKLVVGATISASALLTWSFTDSYFEISKNLDIYTTLFRELNLYYVDETKPGELTRAGIDAMLSTLDPYTEFIPESDIEEYKMKYVSSEYGGVGAVVFIRDGQAVISEVYEGFPAQEAGLQPGDVFVEISGREIKNMKLEQVSDLLKGPANTSVKVVLKREGEASLIEKLLQREEIKLGNVPYYGLINDSTGYIKLDQFLRNSADEVRNAFTELKNKHHIKSLVFDLRGNGGGILQESVAILNMFIEQGQTVVTQKGRVKEMNAVYKTTQPAMDSKIPIAVLVDGNSASASEILAGAVQDLERGVIIGKPSFGKGLVQQTKPLSYNAQLKLTIARYYTPSGRCVQKLNYSHRKADGTAEQVPDSLINEFKTSKGRSVYDGSGIYPDIKTGYKTYSNIVISLASKGLLFDYATKYKAAHPGIAPARSFSLTDAEYEDFITFLSGKEYDYTTKSEKLLQDMKAVAEKEKYFESVKNEYEAMQAKIKHDKQNDLVKHKEEIKELLEDEIVSRYYYEKGRTEASFDEDEDIREALKVLGSYKEYVAILNGEGNYKVIGKPKNEMLAKGNPMNDD